jgi:hypothetical protein
MHRNEQVGILGAGDLIAPLERDEIVAVAGQHGLHARLPVDLRGQRTRHRQGDVLLQRAAGAVRTGILAAMAGVDRDHHLAVALEQQRRLTRGQGAVARAAQGGGDGRRIVADGCRSGRRGGGAGRHRGRRVRARGGSHYSGGNVSGSRRHGAAGIEVEHQPITVTVHRPQHEALGLRTRPHLDLETQAIALLPAAQTAVEAGRCGRGEAAAGTAGGQFEHDAGIAWVGDHLGGAGKVEHDAGVGRTRPGAGGLDLGRGGGRAGQGQHGGQPDRSPPTCPQRAHDAD